MQAVILAAGLGTRLRPITERVPKALVPFRDKPMILYVLEALPQEIDEVIIVIGYLGEQIKNLLGESYAGKKLVYVVQEKQIGTLNALETAKPLLDHRFMVLNTDDIIKKEDLEELLKFSVSVLTTDYELTNPFGVCTVDEEGNIIDVVEKPVYKSLINTGTYVLDKRIFDIHIEPNSKGELVLATAIGELAKQVKIKTVKINVYKTVTTPEDLKTDLHFLQ